MSEEKKPLEEVETTKPQEPAPQFSGNQPPPPPPVPTPPAPIEDG